MKKEQVEILIDLALIDLENYLEKYKIKGDAWPENITKSVLLKIKEECQKGDSNFSIRLLRAFIDISIVSSRNFDGTPLSDSIFNLYEFFYLYIPSFKDLENLGLDFGKGNPF